MSCARTVSDTFAKDRIAPSAVARWKTRDARAVLTRHVGEVSALRIGSTAERQSTSCDGAFGYRGQAVTADTLERAGDTRDRQSLTLAPG